MAGEYVLPEAGSITMSRDAAARLLGGASGDAALLYIYILTCGGRFEPNDASAAIHRSPAQVEGAMDVLERLGLVSRRDKRAPAAPERSEEMPSYTAEDIEREVKNGGTFPALVDEVQKALGTTLSSENLRTLFGIYDYLRLPPEVIMTLVGWCVSEYERRSGPGRRPSMRYIEKEAYAWEREGVFSCEAAEEYMKRRSAINEGERELAGAIGISGRALSVTERKYLDAWAQMGFDRDAVAIAYDRTVVKTGRLTWRYMDSILQSWHSKGLHTAKEIEAGDAPAQIRAPKSQSKAGGGGRTTATEYEQMRETLRKLKGESK